MLETMENNRNYYPSALMDFFMENCWQILLIIKIAKIIMCHETQQWRNYEKDYY